VLATVAISIPLACTKAPNAAEFKDATISLDMDLESGSHGPKRPQVVLTVTDPKQLEALLAFFPDMFRKDLWPEPGGWISGAEIAFVKRDGETIRVAVSVNDDLATYFSSAAGEGDKKVRGDLKAFLLDLQKRQAATQPATRPAAGTGRAGVYEGPPLPAGWDRAKMMVALAAELKRLAEKDLPQYEFSRPADGIRLAWRTQKYDVPRPTGKIGKETEIRHETGPAENGLILRIFNPLPDGESGQMMRPQSVDNAGLWTTYCGDLHVPELKVHLEFNLEYGAKTPKELVQEFGNIKACLENAIRQAVRPATQQ
jgi:hypothetical protein